MLLTAAPHQSNCNKCRQRLKEATTTAAAGLSDSVETSRRHKHASVPTRVRLQSHCPNMLTYFCCEFLAMFLHDKLSDEVRVKNNFE